MKRMLVAVVAMSLAAVAARADWGGPGAAPGAGPVQMPQVGGPNTVLGLGDPYNGVAPDKYGLNPRLKKMFHIGPRTANPVPPSQFYPQMGYNQGGPAYNPTGYPPGAYGQAQGTLVFPNHTFARSPRDYFMYEPKR